MELDPKRLLVLHAVSQAAGITAAARLLGHTPSAISQQLQRLETEAGTALFDRSGGRLELTEAGRLLAEGGRRVGKALADTAESLGGLGTRATGPVRMGISAWGLREIAVPALRILRENHPQLQPIVVEADQLDGLRALRNSTLDLLVLSDDRTSAVALPPGVQGRVLNEDEYRLVVPASWSLPNSPGELDGRPWIVGPAHTASGRACARFLSLHGIEPEVRHEARQPSAVQALVAGGLGAAVLPAFVAARLRATVATPIPVPGSYLVRMLLRGGPGGPPPAVRAAGLAIHQAALDATEQYAASGLAPREPVVSARLLDPSES